MPVPSNVQSAIISIKQSLKGNVLKKLMMSFFKKEKKLIVLLVRIARKVSVFAEFQVSLKYTKDQRYAKNSIQFGIIVDFGFKNQIKSNQPQQLASKNCFSGLYLINHANCFFSWLKGSNWFCSWTMMGLWQRFRVSQTTPT